MEVSIYRVKLSRKDAKKIFRYNERNTWMVVSHETDAPVAMSASIYWDSEWTIIDSI
jgi:hypothetical protein